MQEQQYFNKVIMGAWVLVEKHPNGCKCSYCQEERESNRKIRLVLPVSKARNCWRRISYRTKDEGYIYLRSTGIRPCYFFGYEFTSWSSGYRLRILPAPISRTHSCSALLTYEKGGSIKTRIKNVRSLFWCSMTSFTKSEGVEDSFTKSERIEEHHMEKKAKKKTNWIELIRSVFTFLRNRKQEIEQKEKERIEQTVSGLETEYSKIDAAKPPKAEKLNEIKDRLNNRT